MYNKPQRIGLALLLWVGSPLLLPNAGLAAHPLATDDTGTQGTAGVEVELSQQLVRPTSEDSDYVLDTGLSIHVGLAESLDIGLTLFYESLVTSDGGWKSGALNPAVDLKWRFLEAHGAFPSMAVRLDYKPEQVGPFSSGGHDMGVLLAGSWEMESFSVHLNLGGYAHDLSMEKAIGTLYVGGTGIVPLSEKVLAGAEITYEIGPLDDFHSLTGMAALVWEAWSERTLSFGAGPAWESGGRLGWILTLGFTAAF